MTPITADLMRQYRRAQRLFPRFPNITGIDIGLSYDERGRPQRQAPARLRLMLKTGTKVENLPLKAFGLKEPIDFLLGDIEKMDVVDAFPPPAIQAIEPGARLFNQWGESGTVGAIVYCNESGAPHLLSCAHLLCCGRIEEMGQPVHLADPANMDEAAAEVVNAILDEAGDAAVARLKDRWTDYLRTDRAIVRARVASLGESVAKTGARTGTTRGIVDGVGVYRLRASNGFRLKFAGFRVIPAENNAFEGPNRELTESGDSGSVWFAHDRGERAGLGIHLAGESHDFEPEYAIACHLPPILKRFRVSPHPDRASWRIEDRLPVPRVC